MSILAGPAEKSQIMIMGTTGLHVLKARLADGIARRMEYQRVRPTQAA